MNVTAAAEGPLKILIFAAVIFGAVVMGVTYSEPFSVEYGVKTAARTACNELSAEKRFNRPTTWEKTFVQLARQAGVNLEPAQYKFDLEVTAYATICTAVVAWRSKTPIFLISDAFDSPPLNIVHRINVRHEVKRSY